MRIRRGADPGGPRAADPPGGPNRSTRPPGRLPLRRVRRARLAAGLLGRARGAGRRPAEGGLRPGGADGRGRADVPQGLLPPADRRRRLAARVLDRHRSRAAAGGAGHRRGRRAADDRVPIYDGDVAAQIWRVDVGRVPLFLLDTDSRRTARSSAGSPGGSTTPTRTPGWPNTSCSASAASARCARWGTSRGCSTSTRGTPRWRRSSCASRRPAGRRAAGAGAAPPAQRTVFTTHTPVPAGNDSYPAEQVAKALAAIDRRARGAPVRADRARAHASRGGGRAVRRHPGRAADEPGANAVSRRHGEVAREMWTGLWPERPVEEVPIGHVTNGVHIPTWIGGADARAVRAATWAPTGGARGRPGAVGRGAPGSPTESCGRRALASAPSWSRSWRSAARSTGWAATICASTCRRRRCLRSRGADDRLRPPGGDLQAARPADPGPRVDAGAARRRPARAGGAGRQGASARRGGEAFAAAPVRAEVRPDRRRAGGVPRRLRPGHRRRAGARLRRLAQPAAPAAGGQRHQRDEVGHERRAAAERARRLVGRGLRRHERLGASGRGGLRSGGAGRARRRDAPPI